MKFNFLRKNHISEDYQKIKEDKLEIIAAHKICHDCYVQEGNIHKLNCDMEDCPFCGQQFIGCGCKYKLTEEKDDICDEVREKKWTKILKKTHRIPYVVIPNICRLCGELWPDTFRIEDNEWQKYIIPNLQKEILCRSCYNKMVKLFPKGWENAT
jgi:hypothetical protein